MAHVRYYKQCPVCKGHTLRCEVQPAFAPGKRPIPLATCDNPDCKMNGFTLREDRYSDMEFLITTGYIKR